MSTPLFGANQPREASKIQIRKLLNYCRLIKGRLIVVLICTAPSTIARQWSRAGWNQRNILTAEKTSRMVEQRAASFIDGAEPRHHTIMKPLPCHLRSR